MNEIYLNMIKFLQSMYRDMTDEEIVKKVEFLVKNNVFTMQENEKRWNMVKSVSANWYEFGEDKEWLEDTDKDSTFSHIPENMGGHLKNNQDMGGVYIGIDFSSENLETVVHNLEEDEEYLPTCETSNKTNKFKVGDRVNLSQKNSPSIAPLGGR